MCPTGKFCSEEGPSGPCNAGYICALGADNPIPHDNVTGFICPIGYFYLAGADNASTCPSGTYSNVTGLKKASECSLCPPGMYCSGEALTLPSGLCFSGYVCSQGSPVPNPVVAPYGNLCPSGHFCRQGTHTPVACPSGTFLSSTGGQSLNDCTPCTPGRFCESVGLTAVSGKCNAGFYCIFSAKSSSPSDGITGDICPVGNYCPEGTSLPITCDAGSYANVTRLATCMECPLGYFCFSDSVHPLPCPVGFYCPSGTGLNWIPCPTGTFSAFGGLNSVDQCQSCPGGSYCNAENATEVSGLCSAGFYCESGVDTFKPINTHKGVGGLCPAGNYCPPGSALPLGCPEGTYQDQVGQSQCKVCPAGYYCSASFTTFSDSPCPFGYYCPNGTRYKFEYPCPPGTFNNMSLSQDRSDCHLCTPGMYCGDSGLWEESGFCHEGYFCTVGAPSPRPTRLNISPLLEKTWLHIRETGGLCPVGHFCPSGSSIPTPCTPGMYCNFTGLSQPSGLCLPGYYCPSGSHDPQFLPCTPGQLPTWFFVQ